MTLLLSSIELLPEFIPVVDVSDPLLEHVVYRVDSLLNILRPCLEEVSNRWHPVLHLCLQLAQIESQ